MAERQHPFACIVLAAGAGKRFGMAKAQAVLPSGERFLDVVVRVAAESGAVPILAVVAPGTEVPAPARPVHNANAGSEPITSLRLGLAQLSNSSVEGVLVWPVDHPLVRIESALAVVDAVRRTRAPIVVPTHEGRRGHPGYFARESWRELMTVEQGGARAVIARYGARVHEVSVVDAGVVRDINFQTDIPHDDGWRTSDAPT